MAKSGVQVIAALKDPTRSLGSGRDRALAMAEGDPVVKTLKITWTCHYCAYSPPWKPEHRCYFCGPGCAEVGGAGPQRVLVNTQLSQCDVGDMMCDVGARKTAETGLSGLSGAGWLTVFHRVCAISGNSNLFCLMNMMQRHWGGFHAVWLFTGTTLCILKYLHDWPRSLLPDCSQAGVIMTVLTGWWLSE